MFEQIKKELAELRDAYQQGNYVEVVRNLADLSVAAGTFVKGAIDLLSSLVFPTKGNRKIIQAPSAEDCEQVSALCHDIEIECVRCQASTVKVGKDEKKLDPATVMLIIQLIGMGIELIKKWRERRRQIDV